MNKTASVKWSVWLLGLLVLALAVAEWASKRLGGAQLTVYSVFPLLGLSAFSLMWTHFIAGGLRRYLGLSKNILKTYHRVTGVLVLGLILLHPGLLWFQLWRDGLGLPPKSYLQAYTGTMVHVALLLGSMSLAIFLLFELKKYLHKKSWWKFVEYAQVVAVFAIFYHGLTLGKELAHGWFRVVWYLYGITLAVAVGYTYWYDKEHKEG